MFETGLEDLVNKTAGAAQRAISRFYRAGNVEAANRIARTPGVLKPAIPGTNAALGSQLGHLGSGMEGTFTLVAHPEHGVAVRKIYDPKGISGPQMIAHKAEAGIALRDNPHVARFLGEAPTRIGPAHFYEHVQGRSPGSMADVTATSNLRSPSLAKGSPVEHVRNVTPNGMQLRDVHEDNVIGNKVVDYLPVKPGAPTGFNIRTLEQGELAKASLGEGIPHPFTNYLKDPRRPGNLMARATRGAPPLVPGTSPAYLPRG